MILVDTSVWIDLLRVKDERLAQLLSEGRVLAHPFVTGELALGNQPPHLMEPTQSIVKDHSLQRSASSSRCLRFSQSGITWPSSLKNRAS